jgi:hypothetical protein
MSISDGKMRISIASPPDREKLVAEVLYEDEQWAEINQESGALKLEIYPRRNGQPWAFPFDEAVLALQAAKARLIGGSL